MVLYVLLGIVLLGVLIMVHEFGHFIAARLTGIEVKEFSIGFGPKLWQRKSKKHDTVFSLRPIPLGGYCMFYGDTDDDPDGTKSADDPRAYATQPVWKRLLTIFCGPLMNFVLAFVVTLGLLLSYTACDPTPYISSVESAMPAEAAGLKAGDYFVSIGDTTFTDKSTVSEVSEAINALGTDDAVPVVVRRGGEQLTLNVRPMYDTALARYRLGVSLSQRLRVAPDQVLPATFRTLGNASVAVLKGLKAVFTTSQGFNQAAGPIGTVQLVAESTQQGGADTFFNLMILISVNLGLFNLIPIPGLDGARLIFLLIEAIRRKPVSQKIEAGVHLSGYVLLLGLMVVLLFKDVGRIFGL